MKKTRTVVVTLILLVFVSVIGFAYVAWNHIFPKAETLEPISSDSIVAIGLTTDEGATVPVDEDALWQIFAYMWAAKPTRVPSVNDHPGIRPCYILTVSTEGHDGRYYIYRDGGQVYVELPYTGVYRADNDLYVLLDQYT